MLMVITPLNIQYTAQTINVRTSGRLRRDGAFRVRESDLNDPGEYSLFHRYDLTKRG